MNQLEIAQAELERLERMTEAQRSHVRSLEEQANARSPVILPAGPKRRLYVNRTNARNLEAPLVVEDRATGERWHATNVKWSDTQHVQDVEFKWSGNLGDSPAAWVETDGELELTL